MSDLDLPPTSKQAVGMRLKLTREALNLPHGVFANQAGVASSTYSNYESGDRLPKIDFAIRLCERYNLTLDWIYRGDPSGLKHNLAQQIIRLRQDGNRLSKK